MPILTLSMPAAHHPTDADHFLLRRFVEGDSSAIEPLLAAHLADSHRVARAMLGNDADADDCVQQVFLAMHASAARYGGTGSVRSWMLGITALTARQQARSRSRRHRRETRLHAQSQEGRPVSVNPPVESDTTLRDRVWAGVRQLPATYQAVFALHYQGGQSVAEIAKALRLPQFTVYSRLRRGLQRLRRHMRIEDSIVVGALSAPMPAMGPLLAPHLAACLRQLPTQAHPGQRRLPWTAHLIAAGVVLLIAFMFHQVSTMRSGTQSESRQPAGSALRLAVAPETTSTPHPGPAPVPEDPVLPDLALLPEDTGMVLVEDVVGEQRLGSANTKTPVTPTLSVAAWGQRGYVVINHDRTDALLSRHTSADPGTLIQYHDVSLRLETINGVPNAIAIGRLDAQRVIAGDRPLVQGIIDARDGRSPGLARAAFFAAYRSLPGNAWMRVVREGPWADDPMSKAFGLTRATLWADGTRSGGEADLPSPEAAVTFRDAADRFVRTVIMQRITDVDKQAGKGAEPTTSVTEPDWVTALRVYFGHVVFQVAGSRVDMTGPVLSMELEQQLMGAVQGRQ